MAFDEAQVPAVAPVEAGGVASAPESPRPSESEVGEALLSALEGPVVASEVPAHVRVIAVEALPQSGPHFSVWYRLESEGLSDTQVNGLLSALTGRINKTIRERAAKQA